MKRHEKSFRNLKDGDVAIDLCSVLLSNTFGDPDDVPAFLFLQLHKSVEDAKVELIHEGILHQLHLKINQEDK
jgi:hypothetical protein